ncbi:MAG: IclR family transcriptional regulator [Halorhabdus sp.]
MTTRVNNTVDAVRKTFRVLEGLEALNGARVTELANHLDLPKSTVHNHLQTLVEEEYVVKDDTENKYRIALRHLSFGEHARNQTLYKIAKSEVRDLAEETGEHANFAMHEHGYGVYVYKATGEKAVKLDSYPGKRVYLHTTGFGKAMLAHMDESDREAIYERHGLPAATQSTTTDREELEAELDEIRQRGYAFDDEERLDNMRCVAAPLTTTDDRVVGAISVSGPTGRLKGDYFREELPNRVVSVANIIEINATYT